MMANSRIIPSPRVFIAVGLSIFVFVSFLLYASVDTNAKLRQDVYGNSQSINIAALRQKVEILEHQLSKNNKIISDLGRKLDQESANLKQPRKDTPPAFKLDVNKDLINDQENRPQIPEPKPDDEGKAVARKPATQAPGQCAAKTAKTDVQMLDAYMKLPFDNKDGGVWKQGFEIQYDKQAIQREKKLEVVVIPHSHCDPGWLKTFEEYYDSQTHQILNGMLEHLESKPDMKFIYAEMSFFELWWSKLSEADREKTRSFLKRGQLEIVTGGWVMTDEANARSFSIVMELIEGHEFLHNHLDFRPKSHWSIDPFGLSSTLAKVVKEANLTHMAVQRVHYSVKKFLAETKQLEFRWRQLYAGDNSKTDIRTHMFPFYSYDVPHTCGPDPSICCQFDFRRLTSIGCPWGKRPQRITDRNVAARAEMLADQYRKKAQLYRMNTVLIPLGDDFRYDSQTEWVDQYENYKQLFDYMNKKPELNINARFGTLADYFSILDQRLADESDPSRQDLPILSGDFFTYADRDDHYWSGYFTSRPFYKHMDRTVQHYVRTADLLFSLALWKAKSDEIEEPLPSELYNLLVQSRRSLGLFQHHDGITGTARDHVVLDYGQKMLAAIDNCSSVISQATSYLLDIPKDQKLKPDLEFYVDKLPKQLKVDIGSSIILHNSLGYERTEVICLLVGSPRARVQSSDASDLKQQIQPRIDIENGAFVVKEGEHELCFEALLPPLGFGHFRIGEGKDTDHAVKIQVSANFNSRLLDQASVFSSTEIPTLSNLHLKAEFDVHTGYLKSVQSGTDKSLDLQMEFLHYGARERRIHPTNSDSMSGAYLFLPDGPAHTIPTDTNSFVVFKGDARQSLFLRGPNTTLVFQKVYLDSTSRSLDILNRVDVRATSNYELSMRLTSPELSTVDDDQFYTDLNGFQMIRRKRFDKLPLQAQFYPMTTAAFLDANQRRVTLLGRQALGVASLAAGQMEVILDRRLMQDDDRGLAQGVTDNKQTESHFCLHVESLQPQSDQNRAGFLSSSAVQSSHSLNYPLITLHVPFDSSQAAAVPAKWTPMKKPFPCDVHLFALRALSHPTEYNVIGQRQTKPRREASMIMERAGVECQVQGATAMGCEPNASGQFNPSEYFVYTPKSLKTTSLTGMYELPNELPTTLQLDPMDLKAIKVEF